MENEIMYIKLDDIIPNRFQPREVFDEQALNKLADSIRQHGVIEPILVRPVSNKYEIIAGERRYKASVLAGLTKIPAIVRQLDDKESSIVAFIENEHRSDVSAIEEARTMERILQNNNMTQEELAKELGVNQSTIANKIRLLNLPFEVQDALMHNEISERHARSLLSVKDEVKQIELLEKIKEKKMTVRELDSEIKSMIDNKDDGFMNYLNSYNKPIANETPNGEVPANNAFDSYLNSNVMPKQEEPVAPTVQASSFNDGFMNFLNNYDNTNPLPTEVPKTLDASSVEVESKPSEEPFTPVTSDDGFMDFLNSYNQLHNDEPKSNDFDKYLNSNDATLNSNDIPKTVDEGATPNEDNFMSFLNNYDNNNPVLEEEPSTEPSSTTEAVEPKEDNFMSFLNNYDNNNPVPVEEPSTEPSSTTEAVEPKEDNFMSFLNNYDYNNPIPEEPSIEPSSTTEAVEPKEDNFMSYLNSYDNNNQLPEEPSTEPSSTTNEFDSYLNKTAEAETKDNIGSTPENVMINNVTPPITSNFNQYVENTGSFVDISKQEKITSVDEIINKLSAVISEIKEKSVYKIDTDEINYDDIYQITIKIDKRDF